jgi:hypothetical protein
MRRSRSTINMRLTIGTMARAKRSKSGGSLFTLPLPDASAFATECGGNSVALATCARPPPKFPVWVGVPMPAVAPSCVPIGSPSVDSRCTTPSLADVRSGANGRAERRTVEAEVRVDGGGTLAAIRSAVLLRSLGSSGVRWIVGGTLVATCGVAVTLRLGIGRGVLVGSGIVTGTR